MQSVGLFKRLIVMIYDGLLLFSLIFLSSALLMAMYKYALVPDSFIEKSVAEGAGTVLTKPARIIGTVLVIINTIGLTVFYFGWFWTHGGQTPGMKAWSLFLVKPDGKFVDWPLAIKRCACALLSLAIVGLGYTWVLLNRRKLAWHDMLSNTQLVRHKPSNATKPKSS